jgi:hypothetical protein
MNGQKKPNKKGVTRNGSKKTIDNDNVSKDQSANLYRMKMSGYF